MKISNTHQRFSDLLKEPRSLTNPEDYLGPNWLDVINFWLYLDTLTEDEKRKIRDSYWALDYHVLKSASDASWVAANEVVGDGIRRSAYVVANWCIFAYATCELIASHKLLEQGKSLVLLPLCLNL